MGIDAIPLYRGIGLRKGRVIQNPLEIRNPGRDRSGGIFFHAMDFEWLARQESEEWAVMVTERRTGYEPRVIKFNLTPSAFHVLEGRTYDHFDTGSYYEWRRVLRFDELWPRQSGELIIDGRGLSTSDLETLEIELGRRERENWIYERFVPPIPQIESSVVMMGERARI